VSDALRRDCTPGDGDGFGWPSAVHVSSVGVKRSAALGTRSTLSRRAVSMSTVAVIPGFSLS